MPRGRGLAQAPGRTCPGPAPGPRSISVCRRRRMAAFCSAMLSSWNQIPWAWSARDAAIGSAGRAPARSPRSTGSISGCARAHDVEQQAEEQLGDLGGVGRRARRQRVGARRAGRPAANGCSTPGVTRRGRGAAGRRRRGGGSRARRIPMATRVSRRGAAQVREAAPRFPWRGAPASPPARARRRRAPRRRSCRAASAATSAASSTTSPRAVLIRKAPRFISASRSRVRSGGGSRASRDNAARRNRPRASTSSSAGPSLGAQRRGLLAAAAGTDRGTRPSCRSRDGRAGPPPARCAPCPIRPERLAAHLGAEHVGRPPPGPRPGADVALPLAGAPRHHEQQRHRDVGRVVGQDVRRVGDGEAPRLGGLDVDVVEARRRSSR